MDRALTAHVVGADQTRSVQGTEVLVFDSFTGATTLTTTTTTTTRSPRTLMGMPISVDGAAGSNPAITKLTV